MVSTDLGIWVGAIFTIIIYTYFINNKQNIGFRFAQSTVIGIALGYIVVLVMAQNIYKLALQKMFAGNLLYIIPILLGLLLYTRYIPEYSYLTRIPVALIVSVGLGVGARASLETDIFKQIQATASLNILGTDPMTAFNNLVFIVGVICATAYFFFTIGTKTTESENPLQYVRTLGRYYLLIYFGTRFGATIMSRLSLFLGRLNFLLFEWLGL
jgi:hypothetical protein